MPQSLTITGQRKQPKNFSTRSRNKMHFAVHGYTAAKVIYYRANAEQPHMGLTSWKDAPLGKIMKSDISIAENYLTEDELYSLERIVFAYLDLAEDRARRHIPMTMEDWAKRLDIFLKADDREILTNAGTITAEIAKAHAESEFERYRIIRDQLYESDFDHFFAMELGLASSNDDEVQQLSEEKAATIEYLAGPDSCCLW